MSGTEQINFGHFLEFASNICPNLYIASENTGIYWIIDTGATSHVCDYKKGSSFLKI